ncbi:hypothetical protein [Chondrinema litorale]|uniref:hypothetical protein n=1 Tax=Chondrinema litorale TaxID=2994555 RepID=UPI00254287B8|nr:hypothetical protein [Chondrinema litorale]UZR96810.1 hypothetical protein OQ292_24230 [Chondrinema litorale]
MTYKGNFYSLPLSTYQDKNSKVLLEDKGDNLQLLSLDQYLLAFHKIPIEKGVFVQNTDHHREKSKSLQEKHTLLLEALGNTAIAVQYLGELEKIKARYYRDNITVILKTIDQVDQQSIQETLQCGCKLCLAHQVYNGYQFVEILDYYQQEDFQRKARLKACRNISLPEIETKISNQSLEPARSTIDFYEMLLKL